MCGLGKMKVYCYISKRTASETQLGEARHIHDNIHFKFKVSLQGSLVFSLLVP